ncbi:hypothetical protein BH18CHL2_BH18CHL2_00200 [soil metagenome]
MPQVAWSAVLPAAVVALLITIAGVPVIGVAAGGAIAGRLAPASPAYQGAIVAVLTILGLAALPAAGAPDTLLILAADALLLAAGAAMGWVGGLLRPSSRDTGRGP